MKMQEILELQDLYNSIAAIKLPLKTAYKFTRLMRQVKEEVTFYQQKFKEIINEFCEKEDGQPKLTSDGNFIVIIKGKEAECNTKISELRNLEVPIEEITFTIDELEGINISISELSCLMPLIKN